jgi:class 3 adenylate cyclase
MSGLMSLYFGEMRTILDRHGGTVEKFIGDAVNTLVVGDAVNVAPLTGADCRWCP